MTFFSYDYLVEQNDAPNLFFIIGSLVLVMALLFTGYRYFKNRADNKYRDLFIIFILGAALFIGINYNNYEKQLDVSNKTNQTITLMKSIAKVQKVSVKKLYSNTSTPAEGMLIKNGKQIYRVSFDNNQNSYTLTKTNLINDQDIILQK